jgi:starch synthase
VTPTAETAAPISVCFVTSEVAPWAKVGGLADVSTALPSFLATEGHEVRVLVPLYPSLRDALPDAEPVANAQDIPIPIGRRTATVSIRRATLPDSSAELLLVDCPPLFDRESIYTADPDEHVRFVLLTRAAIETCQRLGWGPDVFHVTDWATALLPLYLRSVYAWDELFARTRTVLTIHNVGYQGNFPTSAIPDTGLGEAVGMLHQGHLREGRFSFLATGLLYADVVTTVSPTYAKEIQTEAYGFGLHDLTQLRGDSLVGILNGVDYTEWDPRTDRFISHRYSDRSLWRKEKNKQALLAEVGLPYEGRVPTLGIVSRLVGQKGFELGFEPLPALLAERDIRLVVLGSGEARYEGFFAGLARAFPDRAAFRPEFDERLAHFIEAGSDLFLMPSRYEPCGLNQLYSLRYGTVPVVRRTGGLADSVAQFDPATGEGTGVVFDHFTSSGFRWGLEYGLALHADRDTWPQLVRNGMAQDFSWAVQGPHYVELYRRLLADRTPGGHEP